MTVWCGSARTNACKLSSSVHTESVQNVLRCSCASSAVPDEPGSRPELPADRERWARKNRGMCR